MIEPEAVPTAPRTRRHRRAVVAGVTLLAVVAGGLAVAFDSNGPETRPLALLAGNGAGGGAETVAAQTGAGMPVAPTIGAAADGRSALYPYGGWGLKFEVDGDLPDLPDHATAWWANSPALDRAALVRIADALGVQGTPLQRDGGWFVKDGDRALSAYGGDAVGKGGAWYLSLYPRYDGPTEDAGGANAPTGPAISRADVERRVRELLVRMDAPRASWKVETTDTEIGVGWACATPVPALTAEEQRNLESEKLRQVEQETAATAEEQAQATSSGAGAPAADTPNGTTTVADPADRPVAGGVASCPPPPAPVPGFNVALYPLLDGRRADWPVWNVTMRSDGRIENLSGSWVTFERGGDYKLRGVDAALKELQSPPVAYAADTPAAAIQPAPAVGEAAAIQPAPAVGEAPAVDLPAEAPACPPAPMPLPAQDGAATSSMPATCAPPAPQVVKITGVELGLIQTSVFEDGQVRLALVPSYRFAGHFDNETSWETSVIALHPDAIAREGIAARVGPREKWEWSPFPRL